MKDIEPSELIKKNFEALSPQLRKAAKFLLDHPDDVALLSMRELAKRAQLPAATFVRLARSLDFPDYVAMRELFQHRMRKGANDRRYSLKARDLQLRSGADETLVLMKDIFASELRNIEESFQLNSTDILLGAVELIERSARVFVLGQRSCFPPAYTFNYIFQLFSPNSILLQNNAGTFADELRGIGPGDLLVAISVSPYTGDVVRAVRYARGMQARIVAITDDRLSPIAREADIVLLTATATPSFFHSITPMIVLAQALLALLMARGGSSALKAIEETEKQLDSFGAYWNEQNDR